MYKFGICGHFAFGKNLLNGQTIKTKILADELCNQYGEDAVKKIDTHGSKLHIIKSILSAIHAMFVCENLLILPAHNGVQIFGPLLSALRRISKCKLCYIVIGGWLPELVKNNNSLAKALKNFDAIYVETKTMQRALKEQRFSNVVVMPNCKKLTIIFEEDMIDHSEEPYPLCTFSRVMQQKGIEDAVEAVKTVNNQLGRTAYTLDIFGMVEPEYQERFDILQKEWPAYVRYRGEVQYDRSTGTLKNYFALLFPTKFYTEGIPGTIIDAYAAGIPVIASRWESFSDVVDDKQSGYGYDFNHLEQLVSLLLKIVDDPKLVTDLKSGCLQKAQEYLSHNVVKRFFGINLSKENEE